MNKSLQKVLLEVSKYWHYLHQRMGIILLGYTPQQAKQL